MPPKHRSGTSALSSARDLHARSPALPLFSRLGPCISPESAVKQLARYSIVVVGLALATATGVNGAPGDTLYVRDDAVSLHEAPSVDAPVVMRLDRGRKLKELRRQDAWVKVIVYGELGRDGWVKSSAAGRNDSPEEQQTETEARGVPDRPAKPKTEGAADAQFLLVVDGGHQSFRATCRAIRKSGAEDRLRFTGSVPEAHLLDAEAVSCEVRKRGNIERLKVRLKHRGRIVASDSIAISFGSVEVRSPGPWGKARAMRCDNVGLRRRCIIRP